VPPVERPQPMPSGETRLRAPVQERDRVAAARVCVRVHDRAWDGADWRGVHDMHEERRWFAGIDWASQEHVVTLCDGQGKKIGERKFSHGGTGISDMIVWLLKASGAEPSQIHALTR